MKNLLKYTFLFFIGAISYYFIEIIYRGFSHPSMFILGGICFISIGALNNYKIKIGILYQMVFGSVIITMLEFITGYIVNIVLDLHVWNYSNLPYNIMGQICLPFSIIWFLMSYLIIIVDDYLRHKFFNERIPKYKFL